jgi:hypothetical protein
MRLSNAFNKTGALSRTGMDGTTGMPTTSMARMLVCASPMEQETINTGGNVVELLCGIIRVAGKDVYKVATLDGDQPPAEPLVANQKTSPWLIFKATISWREGYDPKTGKLASEDIVIPFDQLQSQAVPIPFIGRGPFNHREADRIAILPVSSPLPATYRK